MPRKKVELEWNAFRQDFNTGNIIRVNVLGGDFKDRLKKRIKSDKINTYKDLQDLVKGMLMSTYWSRTEYEVFVNGAHSRFDEVKLDVWFQIELNLDRLLEYIIRELNIELNKS